MQKTLTAIFFTLITLTTFAQKGRISGTISDSKTGELLTGAAVLIEGTAKGAVTDFDGKFAINNVEPGKVNLVVSYITYVTKKLTGVEVSASEPTNINIVLDPSTSQDLESVDVVVTLNKENNTALVLQQKNSANLSDGISAEVIRKTPDRSTSDVLKRVSGVTIQDDKFVIIRGLNERYNASYLNNSPLPSTEPDRKAFAFDLFPANMLDNLVIVKTATPDQPAEFAGGIVQVTTKSIPEKNFISFTAGSAYNTVTTGKTKTIYDGGKLDKFGFDDGSRNLPSEVPALTDKASWISNKDQARVAKLFPNDWGYSTGKFAPNLQGQLSAGYNFKRKGKDFFGAIASISYYNTQSLYTLQRAEYVGLLIANNNANDVQKENEYYNRISQTQTSTGALLNLACKINENNQISLKNLATGYTDNKFINANGVSPLDAPGSLNRINTRFFTANQILSSQLNGEHFIPSQKIKINWNTGYSNIQRSVPNMRVTSYTKNDAILDPSSPNPKDTVYRADIANGQNTGPNYAGYRIYSKLNERIINQKIDVSRPFKINDNLKIEAKVGGLYQNRSRAYSIRQFGLNQYSAPGVFKDDSLLYLPENEIFSAQNMSVTPLGTGGFKATEITHADDNYQADSRLSAAYAMGELKFKEKLRVIAGLRSESYFQQVNINYGSIDSVIVKSTIRDILPSINAVYNLSEKTGLRMAYYKTLNRAEFRELAVTNWYDPETRLSIAGNAALTRAYIQNADARYEFYPGKGQLFTATGFYKYFNSPIERYMQSFSENQIYYRNANFANVYGAELEFRIILGSVMHKDSSKFLNNLSLFSNLALIKSKVNVAGINSKVPDTRTMQGQAPYIINAGISYTDNDRNFSVTGMVNRVGPRIYIVGNEQVANRWENARTVVDFQVTKSFLKKRLELRFTVKDLLHQNSVIYYKGNDRKSNEYDANIDYINFKRNFGSTYTFAITYKI
jgi:hypothetical protein